MSSKKGDSGVRNRERECQLTLLLCGDLWRGGDQEVGAGVGDQDVGAGVRDQEVSAGVGTGAAGEAGCEKGAEMRVMKKICRLYA